MDWFKIGIKAVIHRIDAEWYATPKMTKDLGSAAVRRDLDSCPVHPRDDTLAKAGAKVSEH